MDDSTTEANLAADKRQPADEKSAKDKDMETLKPTFEQQQQRTEEPTAIVDRSRAAPASATIVEQPGFATHTSSEKDNENSGRGGEGSEERPTGELNEPQDTGIASVLGSPIVPKLSLRAKAAEESFENKRCDIGWAGGKRGKGLMRLVDMEIQKWLCTQEAKVNKRAALVNR